MKKKLTMINNIVCAVLLIATFVTMLQPWREYSKREKYKVRYCNYCKTLAELDENNKVVDGYVCPGSSEMTVAEYNKRKLVVEEVETTEPAADANEPGAEATEPVEATEADVAAEPEAEQTADTTEPAEETTAPAEEETEDENAIITVACADLKPKYKMEQRVNEIPAEASVMGFTWLTFNHKELSEEIVAEGNTVNDVVVAPFVFTLCGIVALLFCLFNMKGTWHSIFLLPAAGFILYAYLNKPIFQVKEWMITMILAAALTAFSVALFVQWVVKLVKWFTVRSYKK